ncbi:MAG TPA: PKD domain-containing protein, partial [Niastella sp.]
STIGGCRYGFFSDFKSSSVQNSQFEICAGDSVQLNAFGGATYQWSPAAGLSDPAIANPKASPTITTDYRVIITDINGCIDSAFVKVVVKSLPPHTPIQTIPICTGTTIKIGNGIKNALYSWNTGASTDSIVVNTAGTYWLQSTVNGCSSRDSMTISLLPNPVVNLGPDALVCKVNNVMLDAGNTGAVYLWHDGSMAQTVIVNSAGKYYVEVTDGNGCKNSDTIVLSQVLPLQADFTYKQDVCNPLITQFTGIGSFINPGWAFGDGNTATGPNSTNTYPAFSNYTVKFSIESGGCKDTITKTITIDVTDSDIILTKDTTICLNSSVQLRTQPALSFCWSPTTWLTNTNTLTPTATPPQNITYYLTAEVPGVNLVKNGDFSNGNVDFTSEYTFTANNIREEEYGIDNDPQSWNSNLGACTDHTTGNGNMLIVNGATQLNTKVWSQTITVTPNTNYAFSAWMQNVNIHGAGSNPPRLQFSINGINLGNMLQGRQQMCIWDQFYSTWNSGNNTTATISIVNQNTVASGNDYALDDISFAKLSILRDSVKVKVASKPVVDLGPDVTLCKVNNIVLDAGNAGDAYLWQDGSTGQTLTINAAGKYYVRVTNANNCESSDTLVISQTQFAKASFSYTPETCDPLSIKFIGTGAGISNPFWDFGDGVTATGTLNTTHTYPRSANYTVKFAVEVNGCKDTITQNISVNVVRANIILTPDTTICYNSTKQLRTQPVLGFCWSPTTWLSNPNSPNPVTSTPGNITYYFTAQVPGTNMVVNGDFSNGATGFTSDYSNKFPNSGEGEYTVGPSSKAWNNLLATCSDHTTGNGNMLIVNGAPTANSVIWSQRINNITPNTDYAFIAWLQNVNVNGSGSNPPQLKFSINGSPLGSVIQSSYTNCAWDRFYIIWNSGSNTSANISIINQNTVRAGNDFALDDISFSPILILSDSVIITVDTPVVKARTDTLVCNNAQVQMQASGAATWAWTPAAGLTNASISNPVATVKASTQYIVTGTTANGCEAKDTVNITLHPIPTVLTDHNISICPNTSVQLNANSTMTSWLWTPALYLNNPAIANPVSTPINNITYSAQVTDQYNCTHVDTVLVQIIDPPFALRSFDRAICYGSSTKLLATGGDTYLWTPAESLNNATINNPVAKPDTSTLYTVYAKENTCGLDTTMQVWVKVNPTPVVEASKENDLNCVVHTTNLHASGTSGTSYLWAPIASLNHANLPDAVATPDTTTRYYVTGTNQYGCSSVDSVTVYVEAEGKVTFMVPNAFTPNGDGHNDCFGVKSWGGAKIEEFAIFNRWGQRVFISNNATACWDGQFKGDLQPAGGYVYVIK